MNYINETCTFLIWGPGTLIFDRHPTKYSVNIVSVIFLNKKTCIKILKGNTYKYSRLCDFCGQL